MTVILDRTDWTILDELQQDGRVPLNKLARRVNLSPSATTERVRRLEANSVITGYRAEVSLLAVGLPLLAVVRLQHSGTRHEPLRQLLHDRPQVLECLRTTGEDCYQLRIAVASMGELERLVDELAFHGQTSTNLVYSQTIPPRGPQAPCAMDAEPTR